MLSPTIISVTPITLIPGSVTGPCIRNGILLNASSIKLTENQRITTRFDKLISRIRVFVHFGCIRVLLV